MHINFLLSHKGRGAGSFWPFDPRLQKRVHSPAVSTHLKAHINTSIPSKMGTRNEPVFMSHLPYCWRSRPISRLFEIARDSKMYTHISQGPENDISEIWSSSPYRKNVLQNGQLLGQSLSQVLRERPSGSECGGRKVFGIGRSYRPETWLPYSRA